MGPCLIDFTRTHRVIRALHPHRTDVDMGHDDRHQNQCSACVHHLRSLHFLVRQRCLGQSGAPDHLSQTQLVHQRVELRKNLHLVGEQQRHTRQRDHGAKDNHRPEDDLLTAIELFRGGVVLADDPAELREPFDVCTVRQVVRDPEHKDHHQRDHKGPANAVVHKLGIAQQQRVGIFAKVRRNVEPPEQHQQPGDTQGDERTGQEPVREPLNRLEARDGAAREGLIHFDRATQQVKHQQRQKRAAKDVSAIAQQRALAELQPSRACVLHDDLCHLTA